MINFSLVLILNTKFEIYENMGSVEKPRISKATLDKKADSSLVSILKQSYNQLEKENKELKEQIQNDTIVYAEIRNTKNRAVFQNGILIEENNKLKNERAEIIIMCQKLDKEVQRLVDEINEPVELEDK